MKPKNEKKRVKENQQTNLHTKLATRPDSWLTGWLLAISREWDRWDTCKTTIKEEFNSGLVLKGITWLIRWNALSKVCLNV